MLTRGFLVTSDGSIHFGPESASLGLSVDEVPCLYAQDPVAQCLIRRCALRSWCLFRFVLFQTWPCLRFCFLGVFNSFSMFHGSLSGWERNTPAHVMGFSGQQLSQSGASTVSRVVFFARRGRHPQMWFVHRI